MITFNIHVGSLLIGFFIGYGVIAAFFLWFDYHDGGRFDQGWKAGCEYGRRSERERIEKEEKRNE